MNTSFKTFAIRALAVSTLAVAALSSANAAIFFHTGVVVVAPVAPVVVAPVATVVARDAHPDLPLRGRSGGECMDRDHLHGDAPSLLLSVDA